MPGNTTLQQINQLYDDIFMGHAVDRSAADWHAGRIASGEDTLAGVRQRLQKVADARFGTGGGRVTGSSLGLTDTSGGTKNLLQGMEATFGSSSVGQSAQTQPQQAQTQQNQPGSQQQASPVPTSQISGLRDPSKAQINPNHLASSQLEQILSKDSPLMNLARTQGTQQANSRGLLNSSMAAGHAQNAMIQNASPLAQHNAQVYASANELNASQANQFDLRHNEYLYNLGLNQQQSGIQENRDQRLYDQQRRLNDQAFEHNVQMNLQQYDQELKRLGYQLEIDKHNVSQGYAATVAQNTLNAINAIQADPNLEPEAKRGAVENIIAAANENLKWAATFYNTPMPGVTSPGGDQQIIAPTPGFEQRPTPQAPAPGEVPITRGSIETQVSDIYAGVLGRRPTDQDYSYWAGEAVANGWSFDQLRGAITNAAAVDQMKGRINDIYQRVLGRDAEPAGMEYWMEQAQQQGWTAQQLETAIRNAAQ